MKTFLGRLFAVALLWGAAAPAVAQIAPGSVPMTIGSTPVIGSTSGDCLAVLNGKLAQVPGCGGAAPSITVGTTPVAGGSTLRVLYDNAGALGEYTNTQLTALINAATTVLSGALPAWPNNTTTFFRGDGTYTVVNLPAIATQATNTVVGNATAGTAAPTALAVGSCSAASSALIWTTNTGFGCNTLGSISTQAASAVAVTGGTIVGLTGLAIRDTSAAFDVTIAAVSSVALTAGRLLTLNMQNVAHILSFGTTANTGSGIIFPNTATDTVAMLGIANTFTGLITANAGINVISGQSYQYNGAAIIRAQTALTNYFFAGAGNLTGSGTNNIGIGGSALLADTSAHDSVAVGGGALQSQTSGGSNTAIGGTALNNLTDGYNNTAIGVSALNALVNGDYNTAVGQNALQNLLINGGNGDTGRNTAVGYGTGLGITSGVNNTILGANVAGLASNLSNSIILAIGDGTIKMDYSKTTASNWTLVGPAAITGIANAATTSALCYNTTSGLLTYNSTIGTCTVSTLAAKNLTAPLTPKDGYDIVMAMEPWRYTMKEGLPTYQPGEEIGFVAEYAKDPRLVAYNPDGTAAGFRYEQYTAALTAAFKYLKADNDNLRAEMQELKRATAR